MNEREELKLALEALDDLTAAYLCGFYDGKNKYAPQRKPDQEPVAWNVVDPTGKIVATEMNSVRGWARIEGYKPTVEGLLGFHEQGWRVVPTTPPRREWIGLTEEERDHFEGLHLYAARNQVEAWIEGVPAFIDAIEAKLREKNTYTTPPQRKPLPPQSPCEMTQAEGKMFKLGWLECEAAHGIKGE